MLKYTNIYDNDTIHKDVYSYISFLLEKKSEGDDFLEFKKQNLHFLLKRDLIKTILMPSCYGLKEITITDRIASFCLENKNTDII
jgi:hypothetical protein